MIVAFASNFLNHHQLPLALAFNSTPGVAYYFLAFTPTPESRLAMGYDDMNAEFPFVVRAYESEKERERAISIIKTADIFISGYTDDLIRIRLKEGKRVYKFSERYFKTYGLHDIKHSTLHFFFSALKHIWPFRRKDVVYLAASAYLKADLNRFFKCHNTVLRWGYFPEHIPFGAPSKRGNGEIKLLWVGRYLRLKHPESAIKVFAALTKAGKSCELTMAGGGECKNEMMELAKELGVYDAISWLPPMPFKEVRKLMRESDIFLFTSDSSEGWGAVLNEAMDSRCAVIATKEAGSTPFLIRNGLNGYSYSWDDQKELNRLTESLADNKELREELQERAYKTIERLWNAEVAAKRLIEFDQKGIHYEDGPCSVFKEK